MFVACPHCGAPINVAGGQQEVSCPACQHVVTPERAAAQVTVRQALRRPRRRRKKLPWGRLLSAVITLVVTASSIASVLIVRSTILQRDAANNELSQRTETQGARQREARTRRPLPARSPQHGTGSLANKPEVAQIVPDASAQKAEDPPDRPVGADLQDALEQRDNATLIDSPAINLTRQRIAIPIEIPASVEHQKSLRIEAIGIGNFAGSVQAIYPPDGRAELGGRVRLALRDDTPHAGIQLSLLGGSDHPSVRIEPLLIYFNGDEHPWLLSRLKRSRITLTKRIRAQQRGIPPARKAVQNWTSEVKRLHDRYGDNMSQADVVRAKTTAATGLSQSRAQLAELETALPVSVQQMQAMTQLEELSGEVHKKATIDFRVFHTLGGKEVDILRTKGTN